MQAIQTLEVPPARTVGLAALLRAGFQREVIFSHWPAPLVRKTRFLFFFTRFIVSTVNKKTIFEWKVDKDHTAIGFELQESTDNLNYHTIYTCEAMPLLTSYSYQSETLQAGKKYYRVRAIDKEASTYHFSKIFL